VSCLIEDPPNEDRGNFGVKGKGPTKGNLRRKKSKRLIQSTEQRAKDPWGEKVLERSTGPGLAGSGCKKVDGRRRAFAGLDGQYSSVQFTLG